MPVARHKRQLTLVTRHSVRHEQRHIAVLEQMARRAAEHEGGDARMAPGTHHDQVGAHRMRGVEDARAVVASRSEQTKLRGNAMPDKVLREIQLWQMAR